MVIIPVPVVVALLIYVLSFIVLMPAIVGGLVDHYALSEAQAGQLMSLQMAGQAVTSVWALWRIQHWPLRRMALIALSVSLVVELASAWNWGFATLGLLRFGAGCALGILFGVVSAAAARSDNPDAIFGAGMVGQYLVGVLVFGLLPFWMSLLGISGMFLCLAACALIIFLSIAWWGGSYDPVVNQSVAQAVPDPRSGLKVGAGLLAGYFLYQLGNSGVWAYLERMGNHAGLEASEVGLAMGLGMVIGAAGGGVAMLLASTRHAAWVTIAGVMCIGVASLGLLEVTEVVGYVICVGLFTFSLGLTVPFIMGGLARADASGRLVVASNLLVFIGFAAGPALASLSLELGDFRNLLLGASAVFALSMVLVWIGFRQLGAQAGR